MGWSECLGLHLNLVICQGSPLFWQISSAVGIRLWGQCGLSTRRWQLLFCVLGASCHWICSRRVSTRCFPYSVPSSRIPGWSCWMCFAFIGAPWVYTLSVLPVVGWEVAQVGEAPFSPELWSPPPLTGVGVVRGPSPSLLMVFPVLFRCGKVLSVSPVLGSQSALNSILALQDLVHMFYRGYFCVH